MNKPKVKKILNVTVNVVLIIFLVICLLAVTVTIVSSKNADGAAEIFGYQMRVVTTGSMEKSEYTDVSDYEIKSIPVRSMVFIETVPQDATEAYQWYEGLKVGDVLTFKYVYVRQETITHRVTGLRRDANGYTIRLDGDNKASDAETLTQTIDTSIKNNPNYVIGKVTGQSYLLGSLVNLLRSPFGLIFIVIIPSLAVMVIEIVKITSLMGAGKRKELDELRKRLAELEAQSAADTPQGGDTNGEAP